MKKTYLPFSLLTLIVFNTINAMDSELVELATHRKSPDHLDTVVNFDATNISAHFEWCEDEQTTLNTLLRVVLREHEFERARGLQTAGADINYQDSTSGNTALHDAVLEGDLIRVRYLLNQGCEPNTQNKAGRTAALLATMKKYDADPSKRTPRLFEIFLHDQGVNWNTRDHTNKAAILLALQHQDPDAFPELLERGAMLTQEEELAFNESIQAIYNAQETLINASPLYRAQRAAENAFEQVENAVVKTIDSAAAFIYGTHQNQKERPLMEPEPT